MTAIHLLQKKYVNEACFLPTIEKLWLSRSSLFIVSYFPVTPFDFIISVLCLGYLLFGFLILSIIAFLTSV